MGDEELDGTLSVFIVLGGTLVDRDWERAAKALSARVDEIRDNHRSPLGVLVVLDIPGETRRPGFTGIRVRCLDRDGALRVVVGLPDRPAEDADRELRGLLEDAVSAAEQCARQQGIAPALPALNQLVKNMQTP